MEEAEIGALLENRGVLRKAVGWHDGFRGQDAGEQGTDRAGDAVDDEGVQGVDELDEGLDPHGDQTTGSRKRSDQNRLGQVDEARSWVDPLQGGSAGGCTDSGGLAVLRPLDQTTAEKARRGCCCCGGDEEGIASGLGGDHAGTVEAEPAEPEKAGTQQDERNAMGGFWLAGQVRRGPSMAAATSAGNPKAI